MRGFGKAVTGSTAAVQTVTSLAALRSALSAGGKNVKVNVAAGTIWNLSGTDLKVKSNTTCDFGGLTLMGATAPKIVAGASNVLLRNLRSHAGDQYGNPDDVDAGNINATNGPVRGVYFANCQFLWGPDVNFALLNNVADVTFERCIIAEGLYESEHSESHVADGHSKGPNIDCIQTGTPLGTRISFIECLLAVNQSRNIRAIGASQIEAIGTTFYNYAEPPGGCPVSLNLLGCTWKKGPNKLLYTYLFRAQDGGHCNIKPKAGAVYVGKKQVIGFTDSGVQSSVRATAPKFTSTEPEPDPASAHQVVLDNAGALPRDKQATRVAANTRNGTGTWVNGHNYPNAYTSLL